MEKEFIPYEQALALKELGFDEPCFGWFSKEHDYKLIFGAPEYSKIFIKNGCLPTPTYSQAFRWFREKYGIFSWLTKHRFNITTSLGNKEYYRWAIEYEVSTSEPHINSEIIYSGKEFDTYEEAELACLEKLIEIVEQKNED